jgi:CheY-like chemotaxis protein
MTTLYAVDDDTSFLELVREVASPMGFAVVEVASARHFMARYGGESDSAVLIDMVMPDMDGIEVVEQLAKARPGCAVIFASGYPVAYTSAATQIAQAKGLTVVARLTKPVKLAELRAALAAARTAVSGRP